MPHARQREHHVAARGQHASQSRHPVYQAPMQPAETARPYQRAALTLT